MKLENQFPTVEQSLELQELGIDSPPMFYFFRETSSMMPHVLAMNSVIMGTEYSVAELSVMLGAYAETYLREDNTWRCGDAKDSYPTQAQASAARLIELLDTGILTAAECNERLLNS